MNIERWWLVPALPLFSSSAAGTTSIRSAWFVKFLLFSKYENWLEVSCYSVPSSERSPRWLYFPTTIPSLCNAFYIRDLKLSEHNSEICVASFNYPSKINLNLFFSLMKLMGKLQKAFNLYTNFYKKYIRKNFIFMFSHQVIFLQIIILGHSS